MPTRSWLAFVALAAVCSIPSETRAQPATANTRTEILFLGTAGGPPLRRDRSEPSTLITVDGRSYLIDCGIGTVQQMLRADIDPQRIKTIFLTHLHSDHDLGLADVLGDDFFMLNLRGASDSIAIYGPRQTRELVDAAFHFIAVAARPFAVENPDTYRTNHGHLLDPFDAHEIERDGLIYQDDRIRVTAAENSHYALMTPQERRTFKSYAYRIETPHGTIVLTGDTGPSPVVARLAQGADVLVAEADALNAADRDRFIDTMAARNHWTADRTRRFRAHFIEEHLDTGQIGELASDAHVRAVVLYHYDPASKADQAAYVTGVRQSFKGAVFAPDDLDRYCLNSGALTACPPEHAKH
ncbi:MAG TPA: MBL fold metallo-hydrolase [Vicinamibacterales bacterium]|jgi:ribonuclease BN (tRNA processing enzyme)